MGLFSSLFKREPKPIRFVQDPRIKCPHATIIYGTKTGNAQLVARQMQKTLESSGIGSECFNISNYPTPRIFSEKLLLIVMSTDGEGELPPNSHKFYHFLSHPDFPNLKNLNYSICALGDSSYEHFCGAGKLIENKLNQLRAKAIFPRTDCDADFKETAINWIERVLLHIKQDANIPDNLISEVPAINLDIPEMITTTLIRRTILTQGEKENATYHIVLDNTTHPVVYQSGDYLEILPENPNKLVLKIIDAINSDPRQTINGSRQVLFDLLKYKFEITRLSRKVVENYQTYTSQKALLNLINNKELFNDYVDNKDILDLLNDFPSTVNGEDLIKILSPLHSRYYSIASSYHAYPKEIHLTIKTVRFKKPERQYEGAATIFMNENIKEGTKIHFKLIRNSSFYLPDNQTPIILIGVGTGIAPYRAFLQDRQAAGVKHQTWLIWGDKKSKEDYLYRDELNDFLANGTLAKLNTCFSRDQETKIYVQNIITQNQTDIIRWINNGAHIFICGHAQMGHDVRNTLSDIIMNTRKIKKRDANQEIIRMLEEGILHEDLY